MCFFYLRYFGEGFIDSFLYMVSFSYYLEHTSKNHFLKAKIMNNAVCCIRCIYAVPRALYTIIDKHPTLVYSYT